MERYKIVLLGLQEGQIDKEKLEQVIRGSVPDSLPKTLETVALPLRQVFGTAAWSEVARGWRQWRSSINHGCAVVLPKSHSAVAFYLWLRLAEEHGDVPILLHWIDCGHTGRGTHHYDIAELKLES